MAFLRKYLCSSCADQDTDGFFNESLIPTQPDLFDIGSAAFPIHNIYIGNDIIMTACDAEIHTGTADGADICSLELGGGGGTNNSRGGTITLYGNEAPTFGGNVYVSAGSTSGVINLQTADVTRWVIDSIGELIQGAAGSHIILSLADTGIRILNGFATALPASLTTLLGTNPIFLTARIGGATNKMGHIATGANTSGPMLHLIKTRATVLAATTIVASGDSLGDIIAYGADGAAFQNAAMIRFLVDATPGAGDMPGAIEFHTVADAGVTLLQRWRVTNGGDFSNSPTNGGNILINNPAKTLQLRNVANGHAGTFIANGATSVVVATTQAATNMTVQFGIQTVGGTPAGYPYVFAVSPGVSFTVRAEAGDTSTYNWTILKTF